MRHVVKVTSDVAPSSVPDMLFRGVSASGDSDALQSVEAVVYLQCEKRLSAAVGTGNHTQRSKVRGLV